jgi:hypothetical protein
MLTAPVHSLEQPLRSPAGLQARPEVLTWDICVMRVRTADASFVACMPGGEYESWVQRFEAGALDAELLAVGASPPRRRLRVTPRSIVASTRQQPMRVGIEHEFNVLGSGPSLSEQTVDFAPLLRTRLRTNGRHDPSDPHAVRFPWGVVTADGREAEVATVPIVVGPDVASRTADAVERAHLELQAILPPGLSLRGYSTHVNVSLAVRRDRRFAQDWATVFAPVMMLLLDGPASPGLLVRPRPGRLELCGDFCVGHRLEAATVFAAAAVRHAATRSDAWRRLSIRMRLERAVERFGYYIDRRACGPDLYGAGRTAMLQRADGRWVSANQHLHEVIEMIEEELVEITAPADRSALMAIRDGHILLPTDAG